jgi:putative heme-binding domain-containing protein
MKTPLLLTLMIGAASAAENPDDPAAELASFQIAEGFEAHLFASEKDGVIKPIQIRFDTRGRLWVIGSTVYPQIEPGQTPNDKVLILEDTNGDGRSDRTTVFADGLMIPTGIELGHGGAYIGHGPELLFLKDTDGDGRADERRVLLRGFGTGDNHQNINSFTWGPGGELWMSQGLHIHSRVETPWGIQRLEQAGIWRFRPHLLRLEGFHGFVHEPQNPWGFVFTAWGEPIVIAGNNSSHMYPVPGLVPNRRDEAPPLIWPTGQGRKCSGGDIVGTTHFPDDWQGRLIMGGYINNAVWVVNIADDASGFRLEDAPPLIRSTSRSFRPVDVKFAPDGSLYICDWYNPIIGHYQASFRHPDRDKTHGRIWRVTAKGRPATKMPQIAHASISDLLEHLKSPDRWTRQFAKRALADRSPDEVKTALDRWLAQPQLSAGALKEALGVYQSHEIISRQTVERLSHAREAGARAYAAYVVGLWADRLDEPLVLLQPMVEDQHPRVRLQALVACAHVPTTNAIAVALTAGDLPTDRFLDYALRQVVFSLKPQWLEAFKAGSLNLSPARLGLLVRADGTPDTLTAVRALARSSNQESYWQLLADLGDASDFLAILRLDDAQLQVRLLPTLTAAVRHRRIPSSGVLSTALKPLVTVKNPDLKAEALKLAGAWKIDALRNEIETSASDPMQPLELRRAAILALGAFGHTNVLPFATHNDPAIASAAIVALASSAVATAAKFAADELRSGDKYADEILSAFFAREGGLAALESAFAATPPSKPAAQTALRLINAGGKRNPKLAHLLEEAAGLTRGDLVFRGDDLKAFVAEVRQSGNSQNGARLLRRPELGCLACHAVKGEGGKIGPDLSALGAAQPIDFIVSAILEPQKEIKEGFTSISVITRDGDEHQGYLLREDNKELVLRDVLQNQELHIPRGRLKEKRANGSVMPDGLVNTLTRAEFRDLVRFLSELGTK